MNDGIKFVSCLIEPLDERIEGLVITFTDITKAKKIELELKEALKVLQQHNLFKP